MPTTKFQGYIDADDKVKVAIYTGSDDAPLTDPLGNLARVKFHNRLRYPAIIAEHSGTLALPARSANTFGWTAHNLFAHGRSGAPLVLGYAVNGSVRRRIAGSWPCQANSYGWGRWLSIGADGTYVRMAESWFAQVASAYAAVDINWVVYVLETTFDATPAPTERLEMHQNDFVAGDFDSRKRYLREGNTLSDFPIVRGGKTLDVTVQTPSNSPVAKVRYSLDGGTFTTNYTVETSPGNFVNVVGSNFNASYSRVTT